MRYPDVVNSYKMRWEIIAGWFVIRCLAGQYVVWYKTPDASDYYNKDEASFVLTNRLFRRFFLGWFIVCQMIIKKVVLITKSEIICLHIFILLIFCILCIAGSSLQSKLYDEYFFFPFFQSSDDDLLLFNPDRHQFFKIIPASYMHKCHKLRILCGWELPGAQWVC